MIPTQTGSGLTPISTARDSVSMTKQDSSYYNSLPRVKSGLGQPLSSGDSTYKHVFSASVQTNAGESHYDQLKRGQEDRPLPSSSSHTDRPLQPPSRLASSCDRCRRLKTKCPGDPKRGPCDKCRKFANSRPSAGGEAICTWTHLESSDKRYLEQRGYLPHRSQSGDHP